MSTTKLSPTTIKYLNQYKENKIEDDLTIICAPTPFGADRPEPECTKAPQHLLENGLVKTLEECNFNIADIIHVDCTSDGQVSSCGEAKYKSDVIRVSEMIAAITEAQILKSRIVVILGGDHSVHLGTGAGLRSACIKLFGYDAEFGQISEDTHFDLQKLKSSPSKHAHGFTNTANLGAMDDEDFNNIFIEGHKILAENILIVGANDPDPDEIEYAKELEVDAVTMQQIVFEGFGVVPKKVDAIRNRVAFLLHDVDLDGMTKATPMPNNFGLTPQQTLALSMYLGSNPTNGAPVKAVQFAEYSPDRDPDNETASLISLKLVTTLGARPSPTIYMPNGD